MRKIIFISLALLLSFNVDAQSNNEKKAGKILNKLSKNYKSLKSLKTKFELIITEPNSKKPILQKGTIFLKDKNFKIEMADVDIVCNGQTQWYYLKELNEVQISKYSPTPGQITPNNVFTIYEKGFKSLWVEQRNESGQMVDIIELVPKANQEKSEYTKIKIAVDKSARQIIYSEIFFRNGRKMKYIMTEQFENINLAANFFQFDVASKKGIQVVDLR